MGYPNGPGYVLDFSDATFSEFFEEEYGIEIDAEKYLNRGTSKGNRLLSFCEQEPNYIVVRVLTSLVERHKNITPEMPFSYSEMNSIIERIEKEVDKLDVSELVSRTKEATIAELVQDIKVTLDDDRPSSAIDRVHTFCMIKFRRVLKSKGVDSSRDEPLHSIYGKYRKILCQNNEFHEVTVRALKTSISILEALNDARNNRSLAHDNELLSKEEAQFALNNVFSLLKFLRRIDSEHFE